MTSAGMAIRSCHPEGLAGVGPPKRLGEDFIEVPDEVEHPLLQIVKGREGRPLQRASDQDAEPGLHPVEPRRVPRRVDEPDPMAAFLQELLLSEPAGPSSSLPSEQTPSALVAYQRTRSPTWEKPTTPSIVGFGRVRW